jgi:hypothetical protein
MEKFNLKKLIEVEGKEQYQNKISNRIVALENLDDDDDDDYDVDIKRTLDTFRANVKISAKKSQVITN